MSNTDVTQAEELNLELGLIFDNSPTFDIPGSGRIQKKDLIFRLESGAFLMHFTQYGSAIFSRQLLGQPIEQLMTTKTNTKF